MQPIASSPENEFRQNLEAAANWLLQSVQVCSTSGSAAFYSRIYHPLRGWSYPYPETTGYIIPTFIEYAKKYSKQEFFAKAIEMAKWIVSLQREDGSLPGGFYKGTIGEPSVFNTAQMLFGLIRAFEETGNEAFLSAATKAGHWLASVQDQQGSWVKFAYRRGFSPSYYTRVAWPMLELWTLTRDELLYDRASKALDFINGRRNGYCIRGWGFEPTVRAFTHTIAYTLEGLLQCSSRLENGERYWATAEDILMKIFKKFEIRKRLPGRFSEDLDGDYWFSCLTGNCQLAICWLILYRTNCDPRLLNAAIKAVSFVASKQKLRTIDANLKGAIPGSYPVWGPYLTFRYPNWSAKFFVDAIMQINDEFQGLRAEP